MRKEASGLSVGVAVTLTLAVLGGVYNYGALAQEVDQLQEETQKIEEVQKEVSEINQTLTEVQITQQFVLQEQSKQDEKLDRIIDKLEEM